MSAAGIQNLPTSRQLSQPGCESIRQKRVGKIIFLVALRQLVVGPAVELPDQRPFARARWEASRVGVLALENRIQFVNQLAHEACTFLDGVQVQSDIHKAVAGGSESKHCSGID